MKLSMRPKLDKTTKIMFRCGHVEIGNFTGHPVMHHESQCMHCRHEASKEDFIPQHIVDIRSKEIQ